MFLPLSVFAVDRIDYLFKEISLILLYLKQESISGHIGQLEHIILSRANQSLLIILNAALLAEKQQIPIS
jgi:hypothetical protein